MKDIRFVARARGPGRRLPFEFAIPSQRVPRNTTMDVPIALGEQIVFSIDMDHAVLEYRLPLVLNSLYLCRISLSALSRQRLSTTTMLKTKPHHATHFIVDAKHNVRVFPFIAVLLVFAVRVVEI
jgi:hypothetical protein